jgi:CysZ protein
MRGSFGTGASYLWEGARLLKHPSLIPFVAVPLLVNICIFATLISLTISAVSDTLEQWLAAIPDWLSFLRWLVWPIVALTLSVITGYLFTLVAILIASPFNALLAEKAEELITGKPVAGLEGIAQAIASFPRSLWRELVKMAYYLPLVLVVFVLSLIPPITAVAPFLWFLLAAWMMAVQYVDYPMDNHLLGFADVKEVLRERRLSSLGFGGVVAVVSGIPILNFFVVPAAVCGATLFWCEELSSGGRAR